MEFRTYGWKSIFRILVVFTISSLSACTGYGVRYGYEKVPGPSDFGDISYSYTISSMPSISLESFCAGKQHNILIGPFILIPLPIIPSVFGILDLYRTRETEGYISLTLEAPPNEGYVKSADLNLYINGELMNPSVIQESENYWKIKKVQSYKSNLNCDEMELTTVSVAFMSGRKNIRSEEIKLTKLWGRLFP